MAMEQVTNNSPVAATYMVDRPRTSGERTTVTQNGSAVSGSSPRGRGKRSPQVAHRIVMRIIPARAGNATWSTWCRGSTSDHPRAGGERGDLSSEKVYVRGSSPRGRGARPIVQVRQADVRIIPARAGNAVWGRRDRGGARDHPRAGGERLAGVAGLAWVLGSSPRGRGTLRSLKLYPQIGRIIPARAGNAPARRGAFPPRPDHPRAGGERFSRR